MRRPNFKKYKKNLAIARAYGIVNLISKIMIVCSLLFMFGIVGHSDFVTEMGIIDDWSDKTYLIYMLGSVLSLAVSCVSYKFTDIRYNTYLRWVNRFEKKWVIVDDEY